MNDVNLYDSLERDITLTTANYAQMYRRLARNNSVSSFFIVYYSVFSIFYGLFPLFFNSAINNSSFLDFLTLSMSIVVLIASLLVSFAKYSERSFQVMSGIDSMKKLKKTLKNYTNDILKENDNEKYKEFVKNYHEIVDKIELRTEIDYRRACKALGSGEKYTEQWKRLTCVERLSVPVWSIVFYLMVTALILFPLAMLIFIF